ncbi:MAG: two-component system response regulator [Syntrophales bacterium]
MDEGNILIVDDDLESLEWMAGVLGQCGYSIETAKSADEAVSRELKSMPDLIIFDLSAPNSDILRLTKTMRAYPEFSLNKIVIVSEEKKMGAAVLESGIDDFIARPFDREEFVLRIRNQMRIKRLEDRLIVSNNGLRKANTELENKCAALQWQIESVKKEKDDLELKNARLEGLNRKLKRKKITIRTIGWFLVLFLASALAAAFIFGMQQVFRGFYKFRDSLYQPMDIEHHLKRNSTENLKKEFKENIHEEQKSGKKQNED